MIDKMRYLICQLLESMVQHTKVPLRIYTKMGLDATRQQTEKSFLVFGKMAFLSKKQRIHKIEQSILGH